VLRALSAAVLACALSAGGASADSAGGGTPAAFVSLEGAAQVVGVELETGRIVARIAVPDGPRDVTSYGARYVLVASPRARAVSLLDAFEGRVLRVWRGFGRPVGVATKGAYAYVADAGRSELVILDLTTWRLMRVALRPAPRDVAVSDAALVTHARASSRVTVAELTWGGDRVRRFRHVPAGGPATTISHQPDTAYAYVTYADGGAVGALDWGTGTVRWRRSSGRELAAITADYYHGRRIWIADRKAGAVLALSARDGRTLRRLRGCPGAQGVALAGTAWVAAACQGANAVAIWSQRTWRRTLVRVGGRPYGVAEILLP
jgi:outer membrane protein assembly factor BamB